MSHCIHAQICPILFIRQPIKGTLQFLSSVPWTWEHRSTVSLCGGNFISIGVISKIGTMGLMIILISFVISGIFSE